MKADDNSLQCLVEEMNGDIRQILGFLQIWQKKSNNTFIYATFSKEAHKYSKDKAVTVSNFDAATVLLNREQRSGKTYRDLLGYFFIDYDLVPLLVQENYLNAARKDVPDLDGIRRLARAADSIARSDKTNLLVRKDQNWKLLDAVGFNACILPTKLISEFCPFAKFPEFYGKFSSGRKMQRELRELRTAFMPTAGGDLDAIKFDYAPTLLTIIKQCLNEGTDSSLDQLMKLYETYGISPDMVKEHLMDVVYNPVKNDLLAGVETKTKAAMTRLYNSKFKESIVHKKKKRDVVEEEEGDLMEEEAEARKKKKKGSQAEGDDDIVEDIDDDESIEVEAAKPIKKAQASKTKKEDKKPAAEKKAPAASKKSKK